MNCGTNQENTKKAGKKMVVNACGIIGLYGIGLIAYGVGKKVIATAALVGIGGLLVKQTVDGIRLITKQK